MPHCRRFVLLCLAVMELGGVAHGQTITLLEGHEAPVRSVRYSPDGKTLITADESGVIIAWDRTPPPPGAPANTPPTWTKIRTIREHRSAVLDLAVTPDGLGFFSAGLDRSIMRHDLPMRSFLALGQGFSNDPSCVAASPDGTQVVTGDKANLVRLWGGALNQPTLGQVRDFGGVTAPVTAVALSPDGKHVLAASADGSLRGWQTDNAQPLGSIFTAPINSLAVGPKGDLIATGGNDGVLRLHRWPPAAPSAVSHSNQVTAVSMAGYASVAVSGSVDQTIRVIDMLTGREVRTLPGQSGPVSAIDVELPPRPPPPPPLEPRPKGEAVLKPPPRPNVDQAMVVAGSTTGLIQFWEESDGRPPLTLAGHVGAITDLSFRFPGFFSSGADGTLRVWGWPWPMKVLTGHTGPVGDLALSSDGKLLASVSADNSLALWTIGNGKWNDDEAKQLWRVTDQHPGGVRSAAVSPRGDQLATGDPAGVVRLFDVKDGKLQAQITAHPGSQPRLAYHPKEARLYSAGGDGLLRVWQLPVAPPLTYDGHGEAVRCVALSRDGKLLATGGDDKTLRLFDAASGKLLRKVENLPAAVQAVAISPDGTLAAAADAAGTITVWKTVDATESARLKGHNGAVAAIAWHPKAAQLASAGTDGTIRIADVPSEPDKARVLMGHQGAVTSLAWTPDGAQLLSGGADRSVRLWNAANGQAVRTYAGHAEAVTAVAVTADGATAIASGVDKTVRLWTLANAAAGAVLTNPAAVRCVSVSSDGKRIAAAGDDYSVHVWDVATAKVLQQLPGHTAAVLGVALSAEGNVVVSCSADKTVRRSQVAGQQVIVAHQGKANDVAVSADGATIATAGDDNAVKLWDSQGRLLRQLAGSSTPLARVAFSKDGKLVAAGGDPLLTAKDLLLWKVADGALVSKTTLPAAVTAIGFSDDSQSVAAAASDNHVRLYQTTDARLLEDVTSPSPVSRLELPAGGKGLILACADNQVRVHSLTLERLLTGHQGAVTCLARVDFARVDPKQVVTGGADKTVRLWDIEGGKEVRQFAGCTAAVLRVAVSRGERPLVAAVAEDRVVRVWNLADAKPLASITSQTPVRALAFEGSRLCLGGDDNLIRVFDVALNPAAPVELERLPGHTAAILSLDTDGERIISGAADNTARLWQASVVVSGKAHTGLIHAVAVAPNGTRLFTSGEDKVVQAWALKPQGPAQAAATLTPEVKFAGATGIVRALALSSDGALLAGAGDDQHARLWSTKDGQQLAAIPTPAKLTSLAFSRDGRKLIVAGADNIVRNFAVRVVGGKHELVAIQEGHGHTAAVAALSLSADGQWLYSVGADRTVRRWFAASDAARWTAEGHAGPIYSLSVGKGGAMVASGSADKTVRLWDARDGRPLITIKGHEKAVYAVAFSHDGTRVASCGADRAVHVWDLSGREGLRLAEGVDDALTSLAFSPNGQWLTAGSQSARWHTWNLLTPQGPQKLVHPGAGHAHWISRVVYNGASQRFATLDYSGKLFLWTPGDGNMIYHQQLPSTVGYAVAYSPDGTQIAAATRNHKVVILAVPPPVQ